MPYEADSITPFVANSPFMSFFYEHPEEYRQHLTHEGELKPEERARKPPIIRMRFRMVWAWWN